VATIFSAIRSKKASFSETGEALPSRIASGQTLKAFMRSLGEVMAGTGAPKRQAGNKYRRNSQFIDPRQHCRSVDRNTKARVIFLAEALERRTKAPGKRGGCLGYVSLIILRALLLRFANGKDGLCCPSYTELECYTGLCRQSIANGLKRLEACKILKIARRLTREVVNGVVMVRQATNAYAFVVPAAGQHFEAPRRVYQAVREHTSNKIKGLLQSVIAGLAMKNALTDPSASTSNLK
jgi:hypothetical protein